MKIFIDVNEAGACLICPFIMGVEDSPGIFEHYCEFFEDSIDVDLPAPPNCPLRQEDIVITSKDP